MKYASIALFLVVAAGTAVYISQQPGEPVDEHAKWKQTAVEAETAERPARFANMKFSNDADLRAPASKSK